jgi:hypothetical protein
VRTDPRRFNRSASTLSHLVTRLEKRSLTSPETMETLQEHLYTVMQACPLNSYSMDLGFYGGKRRRRKLSAGQTIRSGPVAAASFSLLAFMLAITFGVVESRLKEMKHVVLEEANAISTAFLRADLLSTADRVDVRELLQDYVDLRVEVAQLDEEEKFALAEDKLEELQSSLWSNAVAIADQMPTSRLFVQSLNTLIEVHTKWVTMSIHYRLPGTI